MSTEREGEIRRRIYLFIKTYGENKNVYMNNIRLYSDKNNITRKEMGFAIQELKTKRAIFFNPKYGWVAR